jgi:hypothetical protein
MTSTSTPDLDAAANLMRGAEGVGGRLTVVNGSLSFRAHALNIQKEPLDLLCSEIASVRKFRHLGIIPNGLAVTIRSGAEYRFVVSLSDSD